MHKEALRAAWVEINLKNLDSNVKKIREKIGESVELIGIIKADAYGHGSIKVAEVLQNNGVSKFAIADLSEALLLRENGFTEEIVMLGITPALYADTLIAYNITPVVCSLDTAQAFSEAALKKGTTVSGFIAVDTGMGRIGYRLDEEHAIPEIKAISELEGFKIKGLLSHLSAADAKDKTYAKLQEAQFNEFCDRLENKGVVLPTKTIANSAAIMELPTTHFDAVRAGIIMYGLYPSDEVDHSLLDLAPVMSVKASIVHLKDVPEGTSISYGRKFTTTRKSKIATLTLGYADGYPRPYSTVGKVIINGHFAPIAGNICMDQCMVDVTDIPDVKLGDEAIIMGSDGTNTILADDIAEATGTINYEIICAFGQRLPKIYI